MATRISGIPSRAFDILGIGEHEEHAYRWLLMRPGATVQELAHALSLSARQAQHLVDAMEARGLTTHSPERPRRYLPAPPDMAIDALILHHQSELQRARIEAQELQKRLDTNPRDHASREVVELIASREAERQVFEQMNRAARSEVLFFVRPPMRLQRLDTDEDYRTQYGMRDKGVVYRCIVDADYLDLPGAVARTQRDLQRGIDIRVVPKLPSKLVLADRRIALMPLNPRQSSVLVRGSALLDSLVALFELLWESAAPLQFDGTTLLARRARDDAPDQHDQLIALMALGLHDKNLADELNLSLRTLNRRIADLMNAIGARSRFQAGWIAATRSLESAAATGKRKDTERFAGAKTPRRKQAAKMD